MPVVSAKACKSLAEALLRARRVATLLAAAGQLASEVGVSTWRVVFLVVAVGLVAMLSAKPDWERMACAKDVVSQARVKVRNIRLAATGRPTLHCETEGIARFLIFP